MDVLRATEAVVVTCGGVLLALRVAAYNRHIANVLHVVQFYSSAFT